jgi:hypothetical protein
MANSLWLGPKHRETSRVNPLLSRPAAVAVRGRAERATATLGWKKRPSFGRGRRHRSSARRSRNGKLARHRTPIATMPNSLAGRLGPLVRAP